MAYKFPSAVVSQHGLLECVMGDCDGQFHGHFWDKLMSLLDTIFTFTMALYLQTERIAEVAKPYCRMVVTYTCIVKKLSA